MMFWVSCALVSSWVHAQSVRDVNNALMSMPPAADVSAGSHAPPPHAPPMASTATPPTDLAVILEILAQPEERIDLAQVEIAVERMIDPRVNGIEVLHQLDVLAANARARFPRGDATDTELKGVILLSTMSDSGPWNGYRPFRYDLDNPFGKNNDDKLLSYFLTSRLGNCVSMPVMFVILGQKLGLPVTLSTGPLHDFAKFRKSNGEWTNLEVTSYGGMTEQHYIERLGIPPLAVKNKVWLQTLTQKQSALVIIDTLAEFYYSTNQPEKLLALTDVMLKADPKNVRVMIYRGDAFAQLSDKRYKRYGSPKNIPVFMRSDFLALEHANRAIFAQADALGWQGETPEHKAAYVKWIQHLKAQGGVQ
jgi:regulator of sirC expression with transglutaminase-like and TPR domain